MWRLTKAFTFEAAHKLPNHSGRCRYLHGHSWKGAVIIEGSQLADDRRGREGMVMDFGELKGLVEEFRLKYLDHHYLNESLDMVNPTSENVARWLFERLEARIPDKIAKTFRNVRLVSVIIEETPTSRCEYSPDPPGLRPEDIRELTAEFSKRWKKQYGE